MQPSHGCPFRPVLLATLVCLTSSVAVRAQLTDITQTPNPIHAGIKKSLVDEIGAGRGDVFTPDSSIFLIERDPFRAVSRGRQLFQRKFTHAQGLGPRKNDGIGDIAADAAIGAGLSDSCAACHGRPQGSAGAGGDVFTRPESRDAPHLFGLGLIEMLGDEITTDLRRELATGVRQAMKLKHSVSIPLSSKGIDYGMVVAHPDGTADMSGVMGRRWKGSRSSSSCHRSCCSRRRTHPATWRPQIPATRSSRSSEPAASI